MQLTFGDGEGLGQRKRTRREVFLAEMDQVVPWKTLLALIDPHYPKMGRPGRQPYPLATMLRIHFLQQWYALSDPSMEEALYEIPTVRRFAQLGGRDSIPDETTILNFRRLLETHDLAPKILERVNRARAHAYRYESCLVQLSGCRARDPACGPCRTTVLLHRDLIGRTAGLSTPRPGQVQDIRPSLI